ncbi:hypothetical protein A6R68_21370 [Neotoma lepida]|uniref:Uncharacterized protein n=1 Tax=Neotoma lepida TaxID=56216 RepID=A0A1A6HQZ7_NEOLE|nr:hypothetical protein A6R68_21370 [Neotoma lepida]
MAEKTMDPSLSHSGREESEPGVGLRLLSLLTPPSTPGIDLSVVSSLIPSSLTAHHRIVTQGFVSYPRLVWLLEYCPRESRESVLALQNAWMEGIAEGGGWTTAWKRTDRLWEDMGLEYPERMPARCQYGQNSL